MLHLVSGINFLVLSVNLIPVSVSYLPVHAHTTSSHSVNSPLSPLSFTLVSNPTSFTNLSHHGLSSGLKTDYTDFITGPFLLSISLFICF